MLREIFAKSPVIMGIGFLCFAIGGLIVGELQVDSAAEKFMIGLGLLGVQFAKPSSTAKLK